MHQFMSTKELMTGVLFGIKTVYKSLYSKNSYAKVSKMKLSDAFIQPVKDEKRTNDVDRNGSRQGRKGLHKRGYHKGCFIRGKVGSY